MWWRILTLNLKRFFNCLEIGDWPEHGCGAVSRNISVKEEIRPWMWTPSSHRLGSEMNKKTKREKASWADGSPTCGQRGAAGAIIHPFKPFFGVLIGSYLLHNSDEQCNKYRLYNFFKSIFLDQRHNFLSDSSEYCLCLKKWSVGSSWPTILISSHKTHYKWPG